jgi:small subunit ribosomal protein S10
MKKQRIRLKLKSFDHNLLEKAVKAIALTAKRTGAFLMGPVPLPTENKKFTVLRSPHVDKEAREQFELKTHKRVLDIIAPSEATMDAMMKLSLPSSVEVEVKNA